MTAQQVRAYALTGADQVVKAGFGVYYGLVARETAGATATARVFDNASAASGTVIDVVSLAANGTVVTLVPAGGLRVDNGIYVDILTGTVEGSVRVG